MISKVIQNHNISYHYKQRYFYEAFTLIEMLIALFIISIVFTIGIMRFGDFSSAHKLEAQVQEIAGVIELTKLRAVQAGMPMRIQLHNNDYQVEAAMPEDEQNNKIIQLHWQLVKTQNYYYPEADEVQILGHEKQVIINSQGETNLFRVVLAKDNNIVYSILSTGEFIKAGARNA